MSYLSHFAFIWTIHFDVDEQSKRDHVLNLHFGVQKYALRLLGISSIRKIYRVG